MRRRSSFTRRIILAMLGCAIFLCILRSGELQVDIASYVTYPFLMVRNAFMEAQRRRMAERESRALLVQNIHELVAERDALLRQLVAAEATARYAADSKEVRDFKQRYKLNKGHVAEILFSQQTPAGHFIMVSGGRDQGVEADMVALSQNSLIGRVSEVYPWYSKVTLITDKNCRVAATCAQTGARGIHEGLNEKNATKLSFVSHFDRVDVGDLVVSHGAGLVFPRGFALGKVKSVVSSGVFHEVEVEPFLDVEKLAFCLLVRREDVEVVVCDEEQQGEGVKDAQPSGISLKPLQRVIPHVSQETPMPQEEGLTQSVESTEVDALAAPVQGKSELSVRQPVPVLAESEAQKHDPLEGTYSSGSQKDESQNSQSTNDEKSDQGTRVLSDDAKG